MMLANKIFAMLMAGSSILIAGEKDLGTLCEKAQTLKGESLRFGEMNVHQQYRFMRDYNTLREENLPNVIRVSSSKGGFGGRRDLPLEELDQINQISEVLSSISDDPVIKPAIPVFRVALKDEKKKKKKPRLQRLLSTKY